MSTHPMTSAPADTTQLRAFVRALMRALRRPRVLLGVIGALLLLYAVIWVYWFVVATLGPFAPLAFVVVAGLAITIAGPWLLIRYRTRIVPLLLRAAGWLATVSGMRMLAARVQAGDPRLARFLRARLTHDTGTGLGLTIGLVVAGLIAWLFLELLVAVRSGNPITSADWRIINLVATLHAPATDQVMLSISFLGSGQTIAVLAAVATLTAGVARRWFVAALLLVSLLASSLFFEVIKLVVARPRPLLEEARIVQGGFSFPSGHAVVSATFYATLAYLLARYLRHDLLKLLVGLLAALLVFAIGVSRVYLGAHYPSDVLAGWVAGAFWLALVAVAEHVWLSRDPAAPVPPQHRIHALIVAVIGLIGGAVYLAQAYASTSFLLPQLPSPAPIAVAAADIPTIVTRLPTHTETLLGRPQEPISLIFVGNQDTLERAFQLAGWTEATHITLASLKQVVAVSLSHHGDPSGPVTPSFLAEQPNALAFNQPVGATFEQRHHVRIWKTTVQSHEGAAVWEATASFDRGFELGSRTFLPTHQIAPDIDDERDYIVASLQQHGAITQTVTVQLVPPELGFNLAGDPFFTYGKAIIVWFR